MRAISLARRKASLWRVGAVLIAFVTALAVYSYLSWVRSQIPAAGKLVPMVVAAKDLPAGTVLTKADLKSQDHPERYLPPLAVLSLNGAVGSVLAAPVIQGEPILTSKLTKTGTLSGLIPSGMRAYTLRSEGLAGTIPTSGDLVDVIATFPREVLGEATAITILRGKRVSSVEQAGGQGLVTAQNGFAVTLIVSPEDAERLALAESMGRITIVLTPNAGDETAPAPMTPRDLLTS